MATREKECIECTKKHDSLCRIVASLINGDYDLALKLARVGMLSGDVKNPLDIEVLGDKENPKHKQKKFELKGY
jgi:hypothetical protein